MATNGRAPLGDRLRSAFLKPPKPGAGPAASVRPSSLEELEDSVKYADDKERMIGLVAAPLAAAIGLLVIDALISRDPAAHLADGAVNKLHVSVSLYHELLLVLLGLSLVMLATALWRKRLYLGMATALYGLALFNLHWWGFGVPFILVASWLLVRAYRLQRDLKQARGEGRSHAGSTSLGPPGGARRPANKRYTPPRSGRGVGSRPATSRGRAG